MKEKKILIDEETINKRLDELAEEINRDYAGKEIRLVCILKGGAFTLVELAKRLKVGVTMDFMRVSSYGAGTSSSGKVQILQDLTQNIRGHHVLLVEDIIDSGRTLSNLVPMLMERGPESLKLFTLLDKPDRRVVDDVNVDYCGFQIPDMFVVGCGMDFAERYRNLPYIMVVDE